MRQSRRAYPPGSREMPPAAYAAARHTSSGSRPDRPAVTTLRCPILPAAASRARPAAPGQSDTDCPQTSRSPDTANLHTPAGKAAGSASISARLFEKIHKRVSLLCRGCQAVFRRQGRDMQQDSAASFHNHPSISVICRTLCRVSKRNGTVRCCACAPCMQESSRSNERSASRSTDCAMVVSFGTK